MLCEYWLSTSRMTVAVTVDESSGLITVAAPIVRKFVGQPLTNLIRWMRSQDEAGLRVVRLF